MKLKLFYLSTKDIRKNKADPVHIVKSCKEFVHNGFDVVLITPKTFRNNYKKKKSDVWDIYGLKKNYFTLIELPTIILESLGTNFKLIDKLNQIQQFLLFSIYLTFLKITSKIKRNDVFYSKSYIFSYVLEIFRKLKIIKNLHVFECAIFSRYQKTHKFIFDNVDYLYISNNYLKDILIKKYSVCENKMSILGYISQYEDFKDKMVGITKARELLNISLSEKIIMYAGKLMPESEEIEYIYQTAKILYQYSFYIVGINENKRYEYLDKINSRGINNISFIEFQPLTKLFLYLQSADILASYYPSRNEFYKNQINPAKSTLYMITNRPVIMADLPSLRELLNDEQVFFVEPDNVKKLAYTIVYILNHKFESEIKAHKALDYAKENTYRKKYGFISELIRRKNT